MSPFEIHVRWCSFFGGGGGWGVAKGACLMYQELKPFAFLL